MSPSYLILNSSIIRSCSITRVSLQYVSRITWTYDTFTGQTVIGQFKDVGFKLETSFNLGKRSRLQMDAGPGSPGCTLEEYRRDKGISLKATRY